MNALQNNSQLIHRLEYTPRLFLALLTLAATAIFAFEFAQMLNTHWAKAVALSAGVFVGISCLVWPYQACMLYLACSIWLYFFVRGQTMIGIGGTLIYPTDVFVGAFLVLEGFRASMRQTHLYTSLDRWMLTLYAWIGICILRGIFSYGYPAVGEAREFLAGITYFVAIHSITRPENTRSVLRWLLVISVLMPKFLTYFMLTSTGFTPRFGGGPILTEHTLLNIVVLAVMLGRDHIKSFPCRLLAAAAIIFLFALMLFSALRSIVISILITLPFLLWITRRYFIKAIGLALTGIAVFYLLSALYSLLNGVDLGQFHEKAYRAFFHPSEDGTAAWRLYGQRWELDKIFSNPFWVLIGQGFGGYYNWYFNMVDEVLQVNPHNIYVVIWSKMGLMGLVLLAGTLTNFFRTGFRFLRQSTNELHKSVIMILMLEVLAIMVDGWGGQFFVNIWILIALVGILTRLWTEEDQNSHDRSRAFRWPTSRRVAPQLATKGHPCLRRPISP